LREEFVRPRLDLIGRQRQGGFERAKRGAGRRRRGRGHDPKLSIRRDHAKQDSPVES